MNFESTQNLAYIVASILFILGIKMLGSASTARRGNQISSIGMIIAMLATAWGLQANETIQVSWAWVIGGIAFGGLIGFIAAKKVAMTGMPEMVALFNGFGGLASLLVGWASVAAGDSTETFNQSAVIAAILIGGVTFTGSIIAYLKLAGKMGGAAIVFSGQKAFNALLFIALIVCGVGWVMNGGDPLLYSVIGIALVLGVMGVIPIGGGDMPVVIAFLNSCSGLAAAAAGFVIVNNVLIVAGCLVGTSGLILTIIMCKAMNRSLTNVLFGGFGAAGGSKGKQVEGEMKAISVEDAYFVLEAARNVVFVPGYGMAVAQAPARRQGTGRDPRSQRSRSPLRHPSRGGSYAGTHECPAR